MHGMKTNPAKWFLWTGAILILLVAIVSFALTLVLPVYIENRLIPQVAAAVELTPEAVNVRRIGWWGADLGPIRLSSDKAPAIAVSAIQLDYSPLSLLQGKVEGLTVVGLEIAASITPEGVSIAGMRMAADSTASEPGESAIRIDTLLPISLSRLSILQSRLLLDWDHRQYTFPVDIHLSTGEMRAGILMGHADLSVFGNLLRVDTAIDQPANSARINFDASDFLLERLSQIGPQTMPLDASGTAHISAWGTVALQPLELTGLSLSARFENTRIATDNGSLHSRTTADGDQPLVMTVKGEHLSDLQWSCAPFQFSGPLNLVVKALNGTLAVADAGWSLQGAMESLLPEQKIGEQAEIDTDVTLDWKMTVRSADTPKKKILFDLYGHGGRPVMASMAGGKVSSQQQDIRIKGHYQDGALVTDGKWVAKENRIVTPEGRVSAPMLTIEHGVNLQPADVGRSSSMTVQATLPQVDATSGPRTIQFPEITLDIAGRAKPRRPWGVDARLKLSNGRMGDSDSGLRIKRLSIDLPLAWPDASAARPGRVTIDAIQWKDNLLGGLNGSLQQTTGGLTMALRHASQLLPGLRAFIKGGIDRSGARIEARIPPHQMTEAIDLGRFSPAAAGIRAIAKVSAYADLKIDGNGPQGAGRLKINNGRVNQDELALLLDGIDLAVQMDDLLQIKSAPQQRLQVGQLTLGDLRADNLDVDFQIEDPETLFIEKAGLNWSQGRINTSALRINSGKADYDLTLFCDRLNLAQLLKQLGAAEASGDGTVNGRIPIRWTEGRLIFDNGFLYSTPGQTGVIQLTGTQALLAGLPPGSPQFTQLDIATEALKDYSYQWAKLNLQSEADILLLKLQFDGKPNRLLPFAYDQSLGQFIRVTGAGQADFKGISIDLNFRSPLNDIIHYKDLLKQQ
jgi:hypothetical protein